MKSKVELRREFALGAFLERLLPFAELADRFREISEQVRLEVSPE